MLGRKNVKLAGYVIGQNGIEPDLEKIEAVNRFLTPTMRQDLNSFMVLINYLRKLNKAVAKNFYLLKLITYDKFQHLSIRFLNNG